ncbi:MAG: PQQ-dependent sugar dehydrogenase [Pirellulales bacterium]|jgi:hypothetical protein
MGHTPSQLMRFQRLAALLLTTASVVLATQVVSAEEAVRNEADAYAIETLAIPDEAYLEVGALAWLPNDRLAVGTRRGEIWFVDHPTDEAATWTRFAHGLHEILGLAWKADEEAGKGGGWLYATHRPEVSRLADTDGDGQADRFETVADGWGISGDYHEYAFGSKFDAKGDIWVVLCLTGSFSSEVPFRGWAMRVTPDGKTVPAVSGIRSPGGIGFDSKGRLLYTDNQGPWNGTSMLKHLVEGDFMGHPGGFRWYDLAPQLEKPDEPKSGTRWATESRRIEQLRPPVVMFPHGIMGNSAAGIACDESGGTFGPFAGQVFVSDQSHSIVMRCFLEEIDGVLQGACFRFREGFQSGSLALQFAPDGSLYVGGTNRGWGSRGGGDYALERLHWTGRMPFEILAMRAVPGGFELEFTEPADPATLADPASYRMKSFTYIYQADYGSPVVDEEACAILSATPSPDGKRVRLAVDNLRECVIHELTADGVRSVGGQPLLHATGWYTLNRIP